MAEVAKLIADIEEVLERLISEQRTKVVDVALDIRPDLTSEDLQNPQDHPDVAGDAMFNFEDGVLAGLMNARMALRSSVFKDLPPLS